MKESSTLFYFYLTLKAWGPQLSQDDSLVWSIQQNQIGRSYMMLTQYTRLQLEQGALISVTGGLRHAAPERWCKSPELCVHVRHAPSRFPAFQKPDSYRRDEVIEHRLFIIIIVLKLWHLNTYVRQMKVSSFIRSDRVTFMSVSVSRRQVLSVCTPHE